jgi:hypothetical protein
MDLSQRKQEFSKAYVKAVAAVCGYATHEPSVDDDSVDLVLSAQGGGGTIRSPRIDLQLKCSASHFAGPETLDFPLKIKNYEDLRHTNVLVPRILVVVLVPGDLEQWTLHSEQELLLRHCGYWYSLRGLPPKDNTTTVTINIPRTQMFSVASLTGMMERIAGGELP